MKVGRWHMGRIIEFQRKHVDKNRIEQLNMKMSEIIGNAEMIETENGDIILDAVSEMKCNEIEKLIRLELLKGRYSVEEVYEQ